MNLAQFDLAGQNILCVGAGRLFGKKASFGTCSRFQGYNNSSIADRLVLGTKSVENYINAIYQELSLSHDGTLHPRVQAVLSYIRDSD